MNKRSVLSRQDYQEYLIRRYFGLRESKGYLEACVEQAFLDLLRGPGGEALSDTEEATTAAIDIMVRQIDAVAHRETAIETQEAFDRWHRRLCREIALLYREGLVNVGAAQRWLNGTLQYAYLMGSLRIPDLGNVYPFCHVPLDDLLMERLTTRYALEPLSVPWHRLTDYDEYLAYQQQIRERFTLVPMDVDLLIRLDRPGDASRLV